MFFLGSGETCIFKRGLPYEGEVRKFVFSGGGAYPMRGGFNFLGGGLYPSAYYGPVTCNTGINKLR